MSQYTQGKFIDVYAAENDADHYKNEIDGIEQQIMHLESLRAQNRALLQTAKNKPKKLKKNFQRFQRRNADVENWNAGYFSALPKEIVQHIIENSVGLTMFGLCRFIGSCFEKQFIEQQIELQIDTNEVWRKNRTLINTYMVDKFGLMGVLGALMCRSRVKHTGHELVSNSTHQRCIYFQLKDRVYVYLLSKRYTPLVRVVTASVLFRVGGIDTGAIPLGWVGDNLEDSWVFNIGTLVKRGRALVGSGVIIVDAMPLVGKIGYVCEPDIPIILPTPKNLLSFDRYIECIEKDPLFFGGDHEGVAKLLELTECGSLASALRQIVDEYNTHGGEEYIYGVDEQPSRFVVQF